MLCENAVAQQALKQALVWGTSAALSHKLTDDKKQKEMTPEEKKKNLKKLITTTAIGAGAGAAGSLL